MRVSLSSIGILLAGALIGCSASSEPEAANKVDNTPVAPNVQIARLDQRIERGAVKAFTSSSSPVLFRKLGSARFKDANELAIWAARSAASDMCRTVKTVKIDPDATKEQLSWSVSCDDTLGISISEKGALQLRNQIDPGRYPDRGDQLAEMYGRPATDDIDVEKTAATLINLNGHLCARVTNISRLEVREGVYEVTCVEYRGGTGTVRYLVDAPKGLASRI